MARVDPTATDEAIFSITISDRGPYGVGGPECVDLGALYPQLSPAGREWYRAATPDQVVRAALNCYWKFGGSEAERRERARKGQCWYQSYGRLWRAQVIERQDKERGCRAA